MSFISVPESSIGYTSSNAILPTRFPVNRATENGDSSADSSSAPSGLCYTCLCWIFRCIPVLIIFLIINCVRAVFFDQKAAFTIINITLGLILFAIIIISVYTFISIQFYRLQRSQAVLLPGYQVSTISGRGGRGSRGRTTSSANDDAYVFDFMDDLGLDNFRCSRCSGAAEESTATSSGPSTSTGQHHPNCPNRRNNNNQQTKVHRIDEDLTDCPPAYEEPPKYEELSVENLIEISYKHEPTISELIQIDHQPEHSRSRVDQPQFEQQQTIAVAR